MICTDCTYQDEMGCNDGQPWWHAHTDGKRAEFESSAAASDYLDNNWHWIEDSAPHEASVEEIK